MILGGSYECLLSVTRKWYSCDMKRKLMLEDAQGFPRSVLVEGQEIEVEFEHKGRKAVIGFEIDGGWQVFAGSRDFPPEYEDIEVKYAGASYLDGDEEMIPESDFDPQTILDLEDQAMEKYEPVKPEPEYYED